MASVSLLRDKRISAEAKVLYQILMSYARSNETCWPSHATLAEDIGLSVRRIADLLGQLASAGLIAIKAARVPV